MNAKHPKVFSKVWLNIFVDLETIYTSLVSRGELINADITAERRLMMKSRAELNQELRQRILSLSDVTERQKAGIHEDAFFVRGKMFMHIHGHGHCDIQLAKDDQERVLAEGKARPHRWALAAGYVTVVVHKEEDLDHAMDLIRMSHRLFCRQTESFANAAPIEPKRGAQ